MLHVVTCPIIFILFDYPDWQGGMLKLMKTDHFLVFLAVWVLFLMFLACKRVDSAKITQNDKNVTCNCVAKCFFLMLWVRLLGRSVHSYEK